MNSESKSMYKPRRRSPILYERIISTSAALLLTIGHLHILFIWYVLALENEPGGPCGWDTPVKVYTKVTVLLLALLSLLFPLGVAVGWRPRTIGIYGLVVANVWIIYLLLV